MALTQRQNERTRDIQVINLRTAVCGIRFFFEVDFFDFVLAPDSVFYSTRLAVDDFGANAVEEFPVVAHNHHGNVLEHQKRLEPLHLCGSEPRATTGLDAHVDNDRRRTPRSAMRARALAQHTHARSTDALAASLPRALVLRTDSKSKWLVGSSSKSKLGSDSKIFPSPIRIFQPPLKLDTGSDASSGMKPICPNTRSTLGEARKISIQRLFF